ncbi:MAG: cell division protein FtsW, partial [Desulfovibrio sp.]|nr:cell division protein FtsW [Desulfovibrio sp.]
MPSALRRGGRKSRNAYTAPKEARFAGLGRMFSFLRRPAGSSAGGSQGGASQARRIGGITWRTLVAGILILLAAGVTLAGICAVSLWLYGKALTSEFFATRHVDVAGNVRLSREMVLQYGGIGEGD